MVELNETHDGSRGSWLAAANQPQSDCLLQNLPFGVFSRSGESPRGGGAIGDQIFISKRPSLGFPASVLPVPAQTAR